MTYLLLIALNKTITTKIGNLGKISFKKGYYLYIGSAKKNFKTRIQRHLKKNKKIFWHIDYLLSLNFSKVEEVWISKENKECELANLFYKENYSFINRFGSSDCRCKSHLFFAKNKNRIRNLIKNSGFKILDKNFFNKSIANNNFKAISIYVDKVN